MGRTVLYNKHTYFPECFKFFYIASLCLLNNIPFLCMNGYVGMCRNEFNLLTSLFTNLWSVFSATRALLFTIREIMQTLNVVNFGWKTFSSTFFSINRIHLFVFSYQFGPGGHESLTHYHLATCFHRRW